MHVHITYTGGTIGMVDSPHGLVPGADLEEHLTRSDREMRASTVVRASSGSPMSCGRALGS